LDVFILISLLALLVAALIPGWWLGRRSIKVRIGVSVLLLVLIALPAVHDMLEFEKAIDFQPLSSMLDEKYPVPQELRTEDSEWSFIADIEDLKIKNKAAQGMAMTRPDFQKMIDKAMEYASDGTAVVLSLRVLVDGHDNDEEQLRSLRDDLWKKGYPAYLFVREEGQERFTQIAVGPFMDRQEALRTQQRLKKLMSLDTVLFRYRI